MTIHGATRRMSVLTMIGAIVATAVVALMRPATATASAASAAPAAYRAAPVPEADARRVYLSDCAVCHGADGAGTAYGPALQGVGRAAVDYYVSTGRMPLLDEVGRDPVTRVLKPNSEIQSPNPRVTPTRHQPAYPPEMISALVDYVHGLGSGGPDLPTVDAAAGDLTRGGEIYRLQCAACHAWSGDGGALYHREAPPLHDATAVQVAEAVRVGPGLMPAFGPAAVSESDLNSLVAYVRSLRHPDDRGGSALWHLGPVAEGGIAILVGLAVLVLCTHMIGDRS